MRVSRDVEKVSGRFRCVRERGGGRDERWRERRSYFFAAQNEQSERTRDCGHVGGEVRTIRG